MVRCHNCHSCSPVCNSRLEAIDMWNSRSFPSWRWTADDPIEVGKYVVSTRERRLEVAVIEAKNTGKLRIRYFDEALETTVTATIEDFKKTLNEYGNFRWFKIEIPDCHPDYAKAQEKTAD